MKCDGVRRHCCKLHLIKVCMKVLPGGEKKKQKNKKPALTAHTPPVSPTATLTPVINQRETSFTHTDRYTYRHEQPQGHTVCIYLASSNTNTIK